MGMNLGRTHFDGIQNLGPPYPIFAAGHGAMSFPKPRNSYDGQLEPWTNWSYPCDNTHRGDNCTVTGVVGLKPKHYAEIGKEVHYFDCNWYYL